MVVTQEEPVLPAVSFHEDFESFYSRELKPVTGLAYALSGSRAGAEDLAQDAFLKAYRQWDTVSAMENPEAWIRRVVTNQSVSTFRRYAAEARALVRFGGSGNAASEMSPDATATWCAIRRLPKRQAQVIALRYYDRSSIADIAQILDLSENTVKTHLRRAKRALQGMLNEGGSI